MNKFKKNIDHHNQNTMTEINFQSAPTPLLTMPSKKKVLENEQVTLEIPQG